MPYSTPVLDDVCVDWIRKNFDPQTAIILDVGAGAGKWRGILPEYTMDAVEAFEGTINHFSLRELYQKVFHQDIMSEFCFDGYDLVIMGDVLEHLTVEDAQAILKKISCRVLIKVPYMSPQGPINGNDFEIHRQPDLTTEVMAQRYPELTLIAEAPIFVTDTIAVYVK